ncbi:mediator of RNA polymerase II transcription subunit 24-like [Lytechinus variegatus]|uniref:mediator of RNA polymerase II transcription subunit 24-like n=1 Tax=Lytechinus variegatus TaxID=7654 RepID=UPI001BB19D3B|nr:mediator of RNA polymerase II transcription subunit 24-like [Lytechinus variegatus]
MEENRVRAVQGLLIKAWRERWADFQWSTKLKQYIVSGSAEEANQIAEMLLTQTFVGPSPSSLILSYLKHAIMSEVVSLPGVLSAMTKYSDTAVTRPYCMRSLLEIFIFCMNKLGVRSTVEEGLQLSIELLEVVYWLLTSITQSLDHLQSESRDILTISRNVDYMSDLLRKMCSRDNLKLLLYIGRLEDEGECLAKLEAATTAVAGPAGVVGGGSSAVAAAAAAAAGSGSGEAGGTTSSSTPATPTSTAAEPEKEAPKPITLWTRIETAMTELTTLINSVSGQPPVSMQQRQQSTLEHLLSRTPQHSTKKDGKADSLKVKLENNLADIARIPMWTLHTRPISRCENTLGLKSLCCSVNVMTFMEAALNLTSDIQLFVDQLLLMERLQNLPRSAIYRELLHASFLGLVEDSDPTEEIKWVAFTFLKLPQIIQRLQQSMADDTCSEALVEGLHYLLKFYVLLDLVDTKQRCDAIKQLLGQLSACGVLNETQIKEITTARSTTIKHARPTDTQQPVSLVVMVTRAEPLINFIKADVKNQDEMLVLLGHMKAGKSFDYMVAAAAARSKLRKFSAKLIKINEIAKQSSAENAKASQVRAVIFDLTFLMLCRIAQLYGTEMVVSSSGDSFFETWVHHCMPDDTGTKPLSGMTAADPNKIDMLLNQYHTGMEFKTAQVRWSEVCLAIPYAIQHLLHAWEYGAVSEEHVSKLVDNLKGRVCCLPICCVAWLCSHMTSLSSNERSKAHRLLQMMMTSSTNSATSLQMYDTERNSLMTTIVKKMSTSVLGSDSKIQREPASVVSSGPALPPEPNTPSLETLSATFKAIVQRGVVDKKSLTTMDALLTSGGALWFCRSIVLELTSLHRKDDLTTAVEIAVALFQVDIEQMTLTLLRRVIPRLLADLSNIDRLSNPRGKALAKLVVWCIAATLTSQNSFRDSKSKESPSRVIRGRKRGRGDTEREESMSFKEENRPSKLRKLLSTPEEDGTSTPIPAGSVNVSTANSNFLVMQSQQQYVEPLHVALVSAFRLFASILASGIINPRTEFILSFVQEVLYCGETISTNVLQFMPVTMATHLLNTLSGVFMQDLALAIGQLEGPTPRKMAAKALCQTRR